MSDRSWSPPLEAHTRTLTTISVTRAKPEHLKDIHNIQVLAYPGRLDFHESEDVFRSKIEAYPAGNFVALATYSVVTDDDTSGWTKEKGQSDEESDEESDEDNEDDEEDSTPLDHQISVIEITETTSEGTTTTTTTTTKTGSGEDETVHIIRARTPDIVEGDGRTAPGRKAPAFLSSASESASKIGEGASGTGEHDDAGSNEEIDEEEPTTTILFQWEKPIGYLFSHPYSRESVTLHRMAENVTAANKATEETLSKKIKVDPSLESESEEDEKDPFEHDQFMERYYIHDCAIHPDWRGKGLASKLWKALEESLMPDRDGDDNRQHEGDLVDTEEEDDDQDHETKGAQDHDEAASASSSSKPSRSHRRRRRGKGRKHHKGAPNLKDIVLVSVQGTRPFWQHAGGFEIVRDHDMDLSVYGDEAFFMSKHFII